MRSERYRRGRVALAVMVLAVGLSLPGWVRADEADAKKDKPAPPVPKMNEPALKVPAAFDKPAPEGKADLEEMQRHLKAVLKKVMPATVCVQVGSGSGSGVIISEDGYVLTAGHVSGTPDRTCTVIFPDGKRVKGKTLGYNKGIDSGLVKISEPGKYPFVGMGDSSKLKVDQWCVTLGHPGGFRPGRTPVLRLGRVISSSKSIIRTDCALVGGDSGGPLFDLSGRVIGIHSRISWDITANLHVPVNTYKETWEDLTAGKEWGGMFDFASGRRKPQAILGIAFDPEAEDLKIVEVTKEGPAEAAGLLVDDVLLTIDGTKLKARPDLMAYLGKKKPGETVKVEVQRGDEKKTVSIKLGKRANS
jgi:serine protease Do